MRATNDLVSHDPFDLLVQWLYTGTIDTVVPGSKLREQLDRYILLFVLCESDYLNMGNVRKLALERMQELYTEHEYSFMASHMKYIYAYTSPTCILRGVAARVAAHEFMGPSRASAGDEPPSYEYKSSSIDFATDLLDIVRLHIGTARLPHPFEASSTFPNLDDLLLSTFELSPTPAEPAPELRSQTLSPSPTIETDGEDSQELSNRLPLPPLSSDAIALTVPVNGMLTPASTPKKSAKDRVRRKSEEEWLRTEFPERTSALLEAASYGSFEAGDQEEVL